MVSATKYIKVQLWVVVKKIFWGVVTLVLISTSLAVPINARDNTEQDRQLAALKRQLAGQKIEIAAQRAAIREVKKLINIKCGDK